MTRKSPLLGRWPSGLRRTPGERVGSKTVSWVRIPPCPLVPAPRWAPFFLFGVWLSPVERCVRDAEVPGSNPGTPIKVRECVPYDCGPGLNRRFKPRGLLVRDESRGYSPRRARTTEGGRSSIRAPRLKKSRRCLQFLTINAPADAYRALSGRCRSGALAEWYCTRLESERPKGLGGSNPSRSVSVDRSPWS